MALRARIFAGLVTLATLIPGASAADAVQDAIGRYLDEVRRGGPTADTRATMAARTFVPAFYAARDNRAAWFGTPNADALEIGLEEGVQQGFRPADFHLETLRELEIAAGATNDPELIALYDVVATDAAARLVHHLLFGKVDPAALDSDWNFSRPVFDGDPATVMNDYLDGEGFGALLDRVVIDTPQYRSLVAALSKYRIIAANGGWPQVPDGPSLKPGMVDARVPVLRARLAAEDALTAPMPVVPTASVSATTAADGTQALAPVPTDPKMIYSDALAADVERFQERHGLEADGVAGPRTLAALNKTAQHRVNQLRLSLERARWLFRQQDETYVLVNIAGARTYFYRDGAVVWQTRSIVGTEYRKTPVFRDAIQYMEVNPTWSVPYTILKEDKLPRIRRDPSYLERNGYFVRRNSDGARVAPTAVNWSSNNPGVTIVQKPGPNNALGRIKFMFPNKYAVYLHDTNARGLFDRAGRNFSSGCVRIEDPYDFADLLMEGDSDYSRKGLERILASERTTRINLPEPIPVLLTYWTAWVEPDGTVNFREDVYGRDGPILEALNALR